MSEYTPIPFTPVAIPRHHRVILADPPWSYNDRKEHRRDNPDRKTKFGMGVARLYKHGIMRTQDICDMGPLVAAVAAPDAYLFLWATCPMLADAKAVMAAWGFQYASVAFVWVKTCKDGSPWSGPGNYTFSNAELVLFGSRARKNKKWHTPTGYKPNQIILEPHPRQGGKIVQSAKPDTIQERIERWLGPCLGESTMLEMFARRARAGWTCLGGDLSGIDIRHELAEMAARKRAA